jgi:hypothetical protein
MDINGPMTPDQLRNALVAEFRELLNRYNANFNIVDRGSSEFFLDDYV